MTRYIQNAIPHTHKKKKTSLVINTKIFIFICICICVYIHMCIYTHIQTHTQVNTHINTDSLPQHCNRPLLVHCVRYVFRWKSCCGSCIYGLSKAFDCLPHSLLIAKQHIYGFSIPPCELMARDTNLAWVCCTTTWNHTTTWNSKLSYAISRLMSGV